MLCTFRSKNFAIFNGQSYEKTREMQKESSLFFYVAIQIIGIYLFFINCFLSIT